MATSAIAGSSAYFSDNETSTQNTIQAGSIDLKLDNKSYYNGEISDTTSWEFDDLDSSQHLFFNFDDVKPGDWGENTISAHVINNDAWLCMDTTVTDTLENGQSEPEALVDETIGEQEGELQNYLSFVFWADDGDNVIETDELENIFFQNETLDNFGTVALADSTINVWKNLANTPVTGGNDGPIHYIGVAWCFGELTIEAALPGDNSPTLNPGFSCDGSTAGNDSQTDQVIADVSFSAIQSRNNSDYECVGCEISDQGYAFDYVSFDQGDRKDGSAVLPARSNPNLALDAPDQQFISLGFGGEVVLVLPGYITGEDVTAFEITNGRNSYPDEKAEVYVSENGTDWELAGVAYNKDTNGESIIDVTATGLTKIKFVKLVDISVKSNFSQSDADGFDLDSIGALVCFDETN